MIISVFCIDVDDRWRPTDGREVLFFLVEGMKNQSSHLRVGPILC